MDASRLVVTRSGMDRVIEPMKTKIKTILDMQNINLFKIKRITYNDYL